MGTGDKLLCVTLFVPRSMASVQVLRRVLQPTNLSPWAFLCWGAQECGRTQRALLGLSGLPWEWISAATKLWASFHEGSSAYDSFLPGNPTPRPNAGSQTQILRLEGPISSSSCPWWLSRNSDGTIFSHHQRLQMEEAKPFHEMPHEDKI